MKYFLLLIFSAAALFLNAAETVKVKNQLPHITVNVLPSAGPGNFSKGPVFKIFRCTNHTLTPQKIEIIIEEKGYSTKERCEIVYPLLLLPLSTSEGAVLVPNIINLNNQIGFKVRAGNGIRVKSNAGSYTYTSWRHYGIASPSFKPDFFEYLLGEGIDKTPQPVKEWSTDSRAYAGKSIIVLNSEDPLTPALREALRLAAARGSRVLVLVMGDDPWPSYAGTEKNGKAFEEKIGFGSWVVLRTFATENNPDWKKFVKQKHHLAKGGKYQSAYLNFRWREKKLMRYLTWDKKNDDWICKVKLPQPPIPIGRLTLIMVCFVIIIGPVNLLVLKKHHAELWGIVTIPLLSLLFTGVVIGCVFIFEGFSSHGKGEVETLLDQRSGLAASRGGFAVYAPGGVGEFRFSPDDLLYFDKPGKVRGEVTKNDYIYSGALVRARMNFSYSAARSGFISEKIAVTEKEGQVEIVNGLGVTVTSFYLRSAKGKVYKLASPLLPGKRAVLTSIPRLPAGEKEIEKGCYRATVAEPFFITPGGKIDKYEHRQTVYGRWR